MNIQINDIGAAFSILTLASKLVNNTNLDFTEATFRCILALALKLTQINLKTALKMPEFRIAAIIKNGHGTIMVPS